MPILCNASLPEELMKVEEEKQLENSQEVQGLQREFETICRTPEEMRVSSRQRSQPLSAILTS